MKAKLELLPIGKKRKKPTSYEVLFEGEFLGIFILLKAVNKYHFRPSPDYIRGRTEPILLAILEKMKEFNK